MNGKLFAIAQTFLAQADSVSSAEWRIRWNWDWPLWFSVLIAIVVSAWIGVLYFREVSAAGKRARTLLILLRLTALALVMAMLAQPAVEWFRRGRLRLVVLVDRSASMDTRDASNSDLDLSRLEACKSLLAKGSKPLIERWQSTYDFDVVTFDEQIVRMETKESSIAEQLRLLTTSNEENAGTRLGGAVDYALRELPGPAPTAIVLFTDGITTRGQPLGEATQRARALRVPLYTVAVGSPLKRPDVAVGHLITEEVVFPGDRLQVEATLHATGFAGRTATVTLRDKIKNEVLAQTTVELPVEGAAQTVRLATRPTVPGELSLQLEVKPLDGELKIDNNSVSRMVEVRDEKIRVLLVQASPSYEYRALKSLLERDPAIELRVHLQEADTDFSEVEEIAISEFPSTEQELFDYDVVVLGDVDPALLPSHVWAMLERFVAEHGGGMACIAGPRFMPYAFADVRPMQVLLPIEIKATSPTSTSMHSIRPTALGWRTPSLQLGETDAESRSIWPSLPPVSWLVEVENKKPGAHVLAEHATRSTQQGNRFPVILRHYVGRGEVLFHATDETWRWRWQTNDRYFARYWGQAVRRLGRGRLAANRQGIQLTTDRLRYRPGEDVRLEVRFRNPSQAPADDQGVVVHLQGSAEHGREIRLHRRAGIRGIFETGADDLLPGKYEGVLLRPSQSDSANVVKFEIELPPRELARLAVDRSSLTEAAKVSGGKSYILETVSELADDLPPPREVPIEHMPARSLWNSHAVIGLFVVVLTCEWLLRRRCGML